MIALALALSFSTASVTVNLRPCDGVVDRTAQCLPPKEGGPPVIADAKAAPPVDAYDVTALPADLGFVSFFLAFGGGAAIVLGTVPSASNDDEEFAQEIAIYTGTGLFVWSALVATGAIALSVFDPSSGAMRIPFDVSGE